MFKIIQAGSDTDPLSKIFDICLITLIFINVCSSIADTFNLPDKIKRISFIIEVVSVVIFSIEYVLRIWTADLLYPEKNGL